MFWKIPPIYGVNCKLQYPLCVRPWPKLSLCNVKTIIIIIIIIITGKPRTGVWPTAVYTSCLHRPRCWACCHAEFSPWLSGWRSASSVRSQVWRERPGRRLQSLGSPKMEKKRKKVVLCLCSNIYDYAINPISIWDIYITWDPNFWNHYAKRVFTYFRRTGNASI